MNLLLDATARARFASKSNKHQMSYLFPAARAAVGWRAAGIGDYAAEAPRRDPQELLS